MLKVEEIYVTSSGNLLLKCFDNVDKKYEYIGLKFKEYKIYLYNEGEISIPSSAVKITDRNEINFVKNVYKMVYKISPLKTKTKYMLRFPDNEEEYNA